MDENLEKPSLTTKVSSQENAEEEPSEDEDGGLDWTSLKIGTARPVIPKRGEKDFEPAHGGPSKLQTHFLDRARGAMADVLRTPRGISSKSISYGIWHPDIARAHVTLARGVHFATMGHSVARPISLDETKLQRRLELLPEEALYLVERGALMCWKETAADYTGMDVIEGAPMSAQQAFAEMLGKEDLTIEKYQVFAYLKRLGYIVTRAVPPTSAYPIPSRRTKNETSWSVVRCFASFFALLKSKIFQFFGQFMNWWRPLRISGWLHHDKNISEIFRSLRFIQSGHSVPPVSTEMNPIPMSSPYKIFFNLYKPSTSFRKTAPPPPDFSAVVVDARASIMPSLYELTNLFDVLPEELLPLPRHRHNSSHTSTTQNELPAHPPSTWPWPWKSPNATPQTAPPKVNPFAALKAGKKSVIVAAVDAGNISFFRFNQGAFDEWPMQ